MHAHLSLRELILYHLCGTEPKRVQEQQLIPRHAPALTGTRPVRVLRYWLKYGCFGRGTRPDGGMKDPRSIPPVSIPDPQNCMCCWYQKLYNPTRPTHLPGLVGYGCLLVVVRLFPPIKPDEVNGMCDAHIDLLYPPKRTCVTSQRASSPGAERAAQVVEVGA
jgi:hypothetical protein